jgi:hypothetical protein
MIEEENAWPTGTHIDVGCRRPVEVGAEHETIASRYG